MGRSQMLDLDPTSVINPEWRNAPYQVCFSFQVLRPRNWKLMTRKQRCRWRQLKTRKFEKKIKEMTDRIENQSFDQLVKNEEGTWWKKS